MSSKAKTKRRAAEDDEAPVNATDRPTIGSGLLGGAVGLNLLVFVSGAVLMGLEIVGSRILAPYFGNSVFVWGSLISLFLIALSLGYYFGGMIADRSPSRALLGGIVIAVAVSLFAVAAISRPVCDAILNAGFGEQSGPFLAAFVLFLLPSLGMGMVSPFAVRLGASDVGSVGRTAGTLYALSTVGSIAGTMLTTFVLIPAVGAGAILKGLAATLLAAGVITFPFAAGSTAAVGIAAAVATIAAGVWGVRTADAALPIGSRQIEEINTPYHHITVVDDKTNGARQLRFDRFQESVIELAPPHRSMTLYTYYFHLAFLARPEIERTLFIGAGGGVGPRSFVAHNPNMQIDVVDIDQKVLDVAREHFYMDDEKQTKTYAVDGRLFVREAKSGTYDCIVLDAFTIGGRIPFHLVTREFFELCRDRLKPGGVFLMNINSAETGEKAAIFKSIYKTIGAAFPGATQAFVLGRGQVPEGVSTNVILVAVNGKQGLSREAWAEAAAKYRSASYVETHLVAQMIEALTPAPDVAEAPLFTDDYAPIETMPF